MLGFYHSTIHPSTSVLYSCECAGLNGALHLLVWTTDAVQVHNLDPADGSLLLFRTFQLCQPLEAVVKLAHSVPGSHQFLSVHSDQTLAVYSYALNELQEVATAAIPLPEVSAPNFTAACQLEGICISQPYVHPRLANVQYVALAAYHNYLHLVVVSGGHVGAEAQQPHSEAQQSHVKVDSPHGGGACGLVALEAHVLSLSGLLNPPVPSVRGQDLSLLTTTLHLRRVEFLPEALDPAGEDAAGCQLCP